VAFRFTYVIRTRVVHIGSVFKQIIKKRIYRFRFRVLIVVTDINSYIVEKGLISIQPLKKGNIHLSSIFKVKLIIEKFIMYVHTLILVMGTLKRLTFNEMYLNVRFWDLRRQYSNSAKSLSTDSHFMFVNSIKEWTCKEDIERTISFDYSYYFILLWLKKYSQEVQRENYVSYSSFRVEVSTRTSFVFKLSILS